MLKELLLSILAFLVIFEEWLWDTLALIGLVLSRILHLQKLDNWLMNANPYQALFALFVPVAIITPFNILALLLLAHGAIVQGIVLEILVKLSGTLLIARTFKLVKNALLTLVWFAKIYFIITKLLKWAHEVIQNTAVYQLSIKIKAAVKTRVSKLWRTLKRQHFLETNSSNPDSLLRIKNRTPDDLN